MIAADWVRFAGGFAELGGVALVAWGVYRDREDFTTRPSVWARVAKPFQRLVPAGRRRLAQPKARATVEFTARPDRDTRPGRGQSPHEYLEHLRAMTSGPRDRRDELERIQKAQDDAYDLRLELEAEREKTMRAQHESAQRFEQYVVSGLRLQAAGAVLVAFGIVATTWPLEIGSWFS